MHVEFVKKTQLRTTVLHFVLTLHKCFPHLLVLGHVWWILRD